MEKSKISTSRYYLKRSLFLLAICILFASYSPLHAASRYWVATSTANWNNTANWSTSSGGAGGASVPGSSDGAYFNSAKNGNCTINATVNVATLNISGYTGTISQGSYAITVGSSNYVQTSGTFTGGDASFDLNGQFQLSGGTFTATSGTMYVAQYWTHTAGGTFSHNNGTVEFDRSSNLTINVNSTETFYNLTLNMGSSSNYTAIANGDVLKVLNTLTWTRGYFYPGDANSILEVEGNVSFGTALPSGITQTIKFSGGNDQTITFSGDVNVFDGSVVINKSAGSVILGTDFTMDHSGQSLTLTSGTLDLNGYDLSNTNYGNTICDGTFNVIGTSTMANYGWSQTSSSAAFTLTNACTFSVGSGDFTMSDGTFNSGNATFDLNDQFILSGGTFNATTTNMSVSNYWTHTGGGTFNHNNGTVIFDGSSNATYNVASSETFYNLTLNKATSGTSVSVANDDVVIVLGTLAWTQGYFYKGSNGSILQAQGNVNFGTAINSGADIKLKFSGGSNQALSFSGSTDVFDGPVIIDKSGGELTLNSDFTMNQSSQSLTLTGGTLNLNGNTLSLTQANTTCDGTFTIAGTGTMANYGWTQTSSSANLTISDACTFSIGSGDFTMSAGTFTSGSATFDDNDQFILSGGTFNASSGNMYVANYWTHSSGGTFNHNNGTVILDGNNNPQVNVMSTETFYNLTCNKGVGNYPNIIGTDVLKTIGTLNLNSGFFYQSSGASLEAQGNVVVGSNYGTTRYITLNFTGSAVQTFDLTGATSGWGGDIVVNKTDGEVRLLSALIVNESNQSLTVTAGTFDINGNNLTAPGSGGSFTVENGGTLQINGDETYSSPTLNSGSTVSYGGTSSSYTIANRSYDILCIEGGASSVFSLPATLTGISTINICSGILDLAGYDITATTLSNEGTLRLKGTETMSITNMDVNSGTVELVGANSATTYTIKDFGSTDYYNLLINDENANKATFELGAAMNIAGTLTVSGGTYSANGQTTTMAGLCTVNGGTYTASTAAQTANGGLTISSGTFTGSSGTLDINGAFTQSGGTFTSSTGSTNISGNFSRSSGTFTHNSGTVNIDGSTQSLGGATTFNNLAISGSGTKTLLASMTLAGNLTMSAATFDLDSYTANRSSGGGTMTLSNGATLKIGGTATIPSNYTTHSIGSTSTIEYDGSTQTVGSLNSSQDYGHLTISGSGTKTLAANTTVSGNLTCNSGTNLTVGAGENLTVSGTITLNGSESLILKSNSSGATASLLDGGTFSGAGSAKFERYLTEDKWHYFSTPIIDASSNSFWNAAVYSYNTSSGAWQAVTRDQTLQKMTGYDIYYANNTTISMSGTPYTGSHSKSLVNSTTDFNFVGNPFLSSIDWDASSGWTKSYVDNAIYIWDAATAGVAEYVNGVGTNGGDRYIPPSQGFFVTLSNGGPYTLGMDNDVRLHNSVAYRADDSKENLLRIKLSEGEVSDETVIYFEENATPFFDGQFDAYKMDKNNPSQSTIYSKTTDGEELSINGLAKITEDQSIPLYIESGAAGMKEIHISGLESFEEGVEIYLEDLQNRKVVDMKTGSYSFSYRPTDEKNRFLLHLVAASTLSDGQDEINDENGTGLRPINTYLNQDQLIIDLTQTEAIQTSLYVYHMSGQLVIQKEFISNGIEKVKLEGKTGYYLVKLVSGDKVYSKKVLKTGVVQ